MQAKVVLKSLGLLLLLFSTTMFSPLLVSFIYQDNNEHLFWQSFIIILLLGTLLWFPLRGGNHQLCHRDGFLIVALFWMTLGTVGAIPFILADTPAMSITDAVFESVSGFTTTGATVLEGLDQLPPSILFYRQQLQWLGGMGVIVLALAVLPILGIGGMQLFRAEVPGPVKDSKLTPRIAGTAKALWVTYLGITVICVLSYKLAGMSWFDAIGHSFSTVANGGYSTHDASFNFFNNPKVELVAIFFMVVSGLNFALHFVALQKKSIKVYFLDSEALCYLSILLLCGALVGAHLFYQGTAGYTLLEAMRHGLFQVVSFMTTSGFATTDFYNWPGVVPVLLVFVGFIGGCAGSTAGGLKVIRVMLLYKQGDREIKRLIHPNARIPVKIGKDEQPENIIDAVWGFFALYVVAFVIIMLLMMEGGLDQVSAFSAVAACINNVGPGLGDVATSFKTVSDSVKWLGCFAMLLGRLEIFTILVLLSPSYWRY
ncbi:MAG: potassium transporter [Gammaproteobacteria bacterium HGW-Gammaproteobacteria-3]|nr:MAG: potassium transporter [Gammaproteobacteria bacterium HGW-Gammaproteobacteria-3]